MNKEEQPLILVVDDDRDLLALFERLLTKHNYRVITADSGIKAWEVLSETKPDIILLDVMMPGMNGYRFCARLQADSETAFIPVIFVTGLKEEHNKAKAFSVGAVDYLVKPIDKKILIEKIEKHLKTQRQWQSLRKVSFRTGTRLASFNFTRFKEFLKKQLNLSVKEEYKLAMITHTEIYSAAAELGVTNEKIARYIAAFLDLPYLDYIDPSTVELGVLPVPFCRTNHVLAVKSNSRNRVFVLSNPFDLELLDIIEKLKKPEDKPLKLVITKPENIEAFLKSGTGDTSTVDKELSFKKDQDKLTRLPEVKETASAREEDMDEFPILSIANNILQTAVAQRASDIHIEPKKDKTVVRFRIDGDMHDLFTLKKKTGVMLINRFKVIADMDIAEKHKPQDGSVEAVISDRNFKLRLATTSTPDGESLIIRLLEPNVKPKKLTELGMTEEQTKTMIDMTRRTHGLILIVGPTGSGKTTTIYSLLSQIDCKARSLVTIEDPVEYRIPFANHQQVNEKAGVTFEALLKSVVRQDPDVIFMGEIRDPYSARMAVDFASTGHLTVSTLHTTNTTTAIFRLERLGIDRTVMADALLCIVAQRLVKKLCVHCKKIVPISNEEKNMLAPFTDEIPEFVAHPVGCPKCNNIGYWGREGVYEILTFGREISDMIRTGATVAEIREYHRKSGGFLISHHAVEKIRKHIFAPRDAYEKVLVEEIRNIRKTSKSRVEDLQEEKTDKRPSILLVDDDPEIHALLKAILQNQGYEITSVEDGIDALVALSKNEYDLIISDINMPNLDGFKLLEVKNQKGIETPVIFLTGRSAPEDEIKGLELGAVDYITKPIKKKLLLLRINKFFSQNYKRR
ncbi:MAG TPA: response regulator [candidate division WOR-3 bacterium]|uniref:Response regulator n=1 Tax=candidate division WOR-3 bacterium TaxID=2052148 RepID=A0A9C9JZA6_UNCW3|nr:response regulator [candidate division WOR-3 bacterium]